MVKNNYRQFFQNNWHWLVFAGFTFISISYLFFQNGVWLFTDSGYFGTDLLQAKRTVLSKLGQFSTTDGIYYGYDNSTLSYVQLPITAYTYLLHALFGAQFGQIVFYLIYYFLCFCFGLKLLRLLFVNASENAIRFGALFLAFNPFSLLVVTLLVVGYVYAAFIVFLYVFISYLESGKLKYLLPMGFFGIHLLSYLRLIPIEFLTLLLIIWIFPERLAWKKYGRWLSATAVMVVLTLPFIVGNLAWINNSDSVVGKYTQGFSKFEQANYEFKSSLENAFSYSGGFTAHPLSFYFNHEGLPGFSDNYANPNAFEFYKLIHIIFNIAVIAFTVLFIKNKKAIKIVLGILAVVFINSIGMLLNFDWFMQLHRTVLVFLYNDYGFMQFIQSFLMSFLVVIILSLSYQNKLKFKTKYLSRALLLFLLLNLLPFFSGHYGLKKLEGFPTAYSNTIFTGKEYDFAEATMFAPFHWLNFTWSPYFLDLNTVAYSQYQTLVIPNKRYIGTEFTEFYNRMYGNFNNENFNNVGIFNIKNIFVFNDLKDGNFNIDTYLVTNIESSSNLMREQLIKRKDIEVFEQNESFTHYRFDNANNYDYLLYTPKKLYDLTISDFYDIKIDLLEKPLIIDGSTISDVNYIDPIDFRLNDPYIAYKVSPDNPNKYYVKIYNGGKYPFLLQLNQMFSPAWKFYFVSENEWESVKCTDNFQKFNLSENERCRYNGTSFDVSDIKYLSLPALKEEHHYNGNIIGNAFLIEESDIPLEYRSDDVIYGVIYFEKQIYYILSLFITAFAALCLLGGSVIQKFKKYVNK